MKKIDELIKTQHQFIDNIEMTLIFMKVWKGNPTDTNLLFGEALKEKYNIDFEDPEFYVECVDQIFNEFVYGDVKLSIVETGLFPVLTLKDKKHKLATVEQIKKRFGPYGEGDWEI